jgi:hypothetical protein
MVDMKAPANNRLPFGAWLVVAVLGLGLFAIWSAYEDAEHAKETLHQVCNAARRANAELLGRKESLPLSKEDFSDLDKIAPILQGIFHEGCGSPISSDY